jgi:hypothetical protein
MIRNHRELYLHNPETGLITPISISIPAPLPEETAPLLRSKLDTFLRNLVHRPALSSDGPAFVMQVHPFLFRAEYRTPPSSSVIVSRHIKEGEMDSRLTLVAQSRTDWAATVTIERAKI